MADFKNLAAYNHIHYSYEYLFYRLCPEYEQPDKEYGKLQYQPSKWNLHQHSYAKY